MPNIEYLLPNIDRTMPPGDPGSGERGDWERVGAGWDLHSQGSQLPCSAPVGPFPAPHHGHWAVAGPSPLQGGLACLCTCLLVCSAAPGAGWGLCTPSFTGFLPELLISHGLCPSGHVPLFNFSSFSPCTPPPSSLFSLCSPPAPGPCPSLLSFPSSSGPVGDLKGTVWHCGLGH